MSARNPNAWPIAGYPTSTRLEHVLLAAGRYQAETLKALLGYQIEMLGFLKHRLEQDARLLDDLTASEAVHDAFDVVADFLQGAAADYGREAGRLATIGAKVGSEAARRLRRRADDIVEDMAARTVA